MAMKDTDLSTAKHSACQILGLLNVGARRRLRRVDVVLAFTGSRVGVGSGLILEVVRSGTSLVGSASQLFLRNARVSTKLLVTTVSVD